VFGHNDKLVAIIVPDLLECRKQGITNIKAYVKNIVEDYNLTVHNYEKILDYILEDYNYIGFIKLDKKVKGFSTSDAVITIVPYDVCFPGVVAFKLVRTVIITINIIM